MHELRRRATVILTVIGLLALSGIALADTTDTDAQEDDTVINYAYDEDNHFFFWNVTSLEYEGSEESTFEDLEETCTIETDEDGNVDYTVTEDGITIEGYDEGDQCGELTGDDVSGPEGQVNHGMFLKLINELYEGDGRGRGCLVSAVAQSDLGMDDQQVNVEDVEETEENGEFTGGTAQVTTTSAVCSQGRPDGVGEDNEDLSSESEDEGRPADAGPPAEVSEKVAAAKANAGGPDNDE